MAVCPRCLKGYNGYPALSRRDNKTDICPQCGTEEALVDMMRRDRIDLPPETLKKENRLWRFIHEKQGG